MQRVVCYCRVSTEEEKQLNALQKQIEELELFVKEQVDWQLIETYVDEGKSGTTTKYRPSYQKLYADLLTDKFDVVLIKDQTRLMRNVLDWYQFLDRLIKSEKQLYLYLDHCFYTPDNKFITGIKAMMAEEYSRDLSKRITSAAQRSQKNGTVYGNNSMLGYRQVNGKLEIIPEEAELVKEIFELYAQGNGFRKISQILKTRGITSSTGTDFSVSTLKRMISNEKYKGILVSHKTSHNFETKKTTRNKKEDYIIIPNGVPAIVPEKLWDKCAELRQARISKYRQPQFSNKEFYERFQGQYLLSGKIICNICGKAMWHDTASVQSRRKGNTNKDMTKWTCRNYRMYGKIENNPNGCEGTRIYDKEMISCLQQVIYEITNKQSKESIEEVLSILKNILQDGNNNDIEIKNTESQIVQLKNKCNKLLDMLLDDTITKIDYNSKKEELDFKIQTLNEKLVKLKQQYDINNSKEVRLKNIENFLNTIYEKPDNIPLEMIKNVLNHIVIIHNADDNPYEFTAKIVLNLLKDNSKDNELTPIYTTTYKFIKQNCRTVMQDWEIIVCL